MQIYTLVAYALPVLNILRKKISFIKQAEYFEKVMALSDQQIKKLYEACNALKDSELGLNDNTIATLLNNPDNIDKLTEWLLYVAYQPNNESNYAQVNYAEIPEFVIEILKNNPAHAKELALGLFSLARVNLSDREYAFIMAMHIQSLRNKENGLNEIKFFVDLLNRLKLENDSGLTPNTQFHNIILLAKMPRWKTIGKLVYLERCTPRMIASLANLPDDLAVKYAHAIKNLKDANREIGKANRANNYLHSLLDADKIAYADKLAAGIDYLMLVNVDTDDNMQLLYHNKNHADEIGQSICSLFFAARKSMAINNDLEKIKKLYLKDIAHIKSLTAGIITLYICRDKYPQLLQTDFEEKILIIMNKAEYGFGFSQCIEYLEKLNKHIPEMLNYLIENIQYTPALAKALSVLIKHDELTDVFFPILMQRMKFADRLMEGVVLLEEQSMLTQENQALLLNHQECASDYAKGLIAIRQYKREITALNPQGAGHALAQFILNLLEDKVEHADKLIKILKTLMQANIVITQSLVEKLEKYSMKYGDQLLNMFEVLRKNHQLTLQNLSLIIENLEMNHSHRQERNIELRQSLNTMTIAFTNLGRAGQLNQQYFNSIIFNPDQALIIMSKRVGHLGVDEQIQKIIINIFDATEKVLTMLQAARLNFDKHIIGKIIRYIAGNTGVDSSSIDALITVAWIRNIRSLTTEQNVDNALVLSKRLRRFS